MNFLTKIQHPSLTLPFIDTLVHGERRLAGAHALGPCTKAIKIKSKITIKKLSVFFQLVITPSGHFQRKVQHDAGGSGEYPRLDLLQPLVHMPIHAEHLKKF